MKQFFVFLKHLSPKSVFKYGQKKSKLYESTMDEQEEVQQNNMISNLPLLFANGYPTSLDKISESQLENFIPFMVQCSLGHINLQGKIDCSEPEWWPEDLPFTIPFTKPKKFSGYWIEKMKEIVIICYQFHKSVFLLRFCNDLAAYDHASLRFINNYNSTTSLFERRSNKLLVTFRNENMSYDQPQRSRKCLMQQKSKNGGQAGHDLQQIMVEPAPFDIYLCDNCDAELYSKEAILEHEKTCSVDDDVILCDSPEPREDNQLLDAQDNIEDYELRNGFLLNFNLQCRHDYKKVKCSEKAETSSLPVEAKEESGFMIIDRNKRMPRRNRAVHSLARCPTIPLSSPAGQLLLRTTKTVMTPEYLAERLDRMERFCYAPLLSKSLSKPKYFEKKYALSNVHCTFKKPQEFSSHMYVFPRRQFSQRRRTENFLFLNSSLIKRCRPISVRLKKIRENEVKGRRPQPNTKLNIKLTRDTTRSSNWKISSPSTEIIVDTIDLCSSDEDDSGQAITLPWANTNGDSYSIKPIPNIILSQRSFSRARVRKVTNCNMSGAAIPGKRIQESIGETKHIKAKSKSSLSKSTLPSFTDASSGDKGSVVHCEESVMSSATTLPFETGVSLPKPLQPSVYIFSNYTNNPLAATVAASNEVVSTVNSSTFRSHNQENHVQSGSTTSLIIKRQTPSATTLPASDWYPGVGVLTPSLNSSSGSSSQNHIVERERTARSLPLVSTFGSPGRIISIDLTS